MRNRIIVILFIFVIVFVSFILFKKTKKQRVSALADKILVIKSRREMHLLSQGKIIQTYKIALGA